MSIRSTIIAMATVAGLMSASAAMAEDPAWASKVKKLLASKQTYPDAAQSKGDQGTAIVKLMIGPDGKLQSVELVKPSGSRVLDREAVTIPSKVGTFPAPGAASSLTIPLTWKLS